MGRRRGPKFSFSITGRKSSSKNDKNCDDLIDSFSVPSITSVPSVAGRSFRYDESLGISSKAQRLLGTEPTPFRAMSSQSSIPPSPGYSSTTTSDTRSDHGSKAVGHGAFRLPKRPALSSRASSHALPLNVAYSQGETRGSDYSSTTGYLHPATSSSTLRSHYDSKNSPLSISQQTSDSAVRDMALRKGKPRIDPRDHDHVSSPLARDISDDNHRKTKPQRLDLSKLFPKPRGHGVQESGGTLLSPNKLVNSPIALSSVSEYFPRPMTREPTPIPTGHGKLTKLQPQQTPPAPPIRPTSPVRAHKRDEYDNAKINIRRPPRRGIQHWFDALSDDSDQSEEERTPMQASRQYPAVNKNSHGSHLQEPGVLNKQPPRSSQYLVDPRRSQNFNTNYSAGHRLNYPSSVSVQSESSLGTTRTKESAFSKGNLQDASVLSFSSSEDEEDTSHSRKPRHRISVRDSIDMTEDSGDIIIGQAQALEVRPHEHSRKQSAGKLSLMSTSTNAATIEVMYTPEPPWTPVIHNTQNTRNSRRMSHVRQPSVIPEAEERRPTTSHLRSQSPSSRSVRTSTSEPRSKDEIRKFMAVTPDEEALLEALRKKRAAMAQPAPSKGQETAFQPKEARQRTRSEKPHKNHKTSGYLSSEPPSVNLLRVVETKKTSRKPAPEPFSLLAPPRGRTSATKHANVRDSSSCDPETEREVPIFIRSFSRPLLSPQPEFSPLDLFPSPTPTASMASPTTTDHPSPLPSPVTPRMRHGEDDVDVKVASSEPSWNGDSEEVPVLETGIIDPPAGSIKPKDATPHAHQRRRTASSGANVPFSLPAKLQPMESRNLLPVTEASTPLPSATPPPTGALPPIPTANSPRNRSLSITTTGLPINKQNNLLSTRTPSPNSRWPERRSSRQVSRTESLASMSSRSSMKRDSVTVGTASTRCSVSEDVLAAWGSLGGMRDYDTARW